MTKITNNASLIEWVNTQAKATKEYKYNIRIKIATALGLSPATVTNWCDNTQPLTAGNAALIQAAIERGEI